MVFLFHSDYGCDGRAIVKHGVMSCTKCSMTSRFGPMTVISREDNLEELLARRRRLNRLHKHPKAR